MEATTPLEYITRLRETCHLPANYASPAAGLDGRSAGMRADRTRPASNNWLPGAGLLILDAASWLGVYLALSSYREGANQLFASVLIIPLAVILVVLAVIGGYNRRTNLMSVTYASEHFIGLLTAFLISALVVYTLATFGAAVQSSRGIFIGAFALVAPLSLAYRRILASWLQSRTAAKDYLVLGDSHRAAQFYKAYMESEHPCQGLRFFSTEDERVGQPIAGPDSPLIEGNLAKQLTDFNDEFDGIILATEQPLLSKPLLARLIGIHFRHFPVYTMESFYETQWYKVPVVSLDLMWPLKEGFQLVRRSIYDHVKRVADIVFTVLALVVTAPLLAIIALLVRMDSRGPVIFQQERVGKDERRFMLYKFRTMRVQSDTGEMYTRKNDDRITRAGQWLRRWRLDELPQLWNVLKADMSLIGPRAEWVKCVEQYEQHIAHYHFRHLVKPGITGWAQVKYPYGANQQDAVEKLTYDLYYIRHHSLWLDAAIVLKTLHVMLFGKGQ